MLQETVTSCKDTGSDFVAEGGNINWESYGSHRKSLIHLHYYHHHNIYITFLAFNWHSKWFTEHSKIRGLLELR